jgi:hypothetical protein
VFVYWGHVSLLHTFSVGQGQRSISQLSAVSMLSWFADWFSILKHSLTLDVTHWLRRWDLWIAISSISGSSLSPAHSWTFCLSSLYLLNVHMEITSLPFLPSPMCSEHPIPSAVCSFSDPCLLFSFFYSGAEFSLSRGLCWFIPRVAVGIWCAAYFLTCCFVSPKQVWCRHLRCRSPPVFSL